MDQPLVSIIMGMYNNEETIDRCIQSVINQTYPHWEFIICDDCSTDHSSEKVEQYTVIDHRIILIRNSRNSKLAASLNHCLRYAKGQYIARMDGDDVCYPERLAKQVDFLLSHEEFDAVGSMANVSDGQKIFEVRKTKEIPTKDDVLKGTPFIHPSIMMKKSAYEKLGGYTVSERTVRGQDLDLWFRFFAQGLKGYNIQDPLIEYYEKKNDYKKRTLKTAIMYTKTNLYGYRLVKAKLYEFPLAFKPILSYLVPKKLLKKYHQVKS